jgi:alpha-tubulin suppressor-like RCC1 family protein
MTSVDPRTLRFEGINDVIGDIAAGFFHNLAVSSDGLRLYMWGCNPQVRIEPRTFFVHAKWLNGFLMFFSLFYLPLNRRR